MTTLLLGLPCKAPSSTSLHIYKQSLKGNYILDYKRGGGGGGWLDRQKFKVAEPFLGRSSQMKQGKAQGGGNDIPKR